MGGKKKNLNDFLQSDWNEFINHHHDPDLLFYYIKQIYSIKNFDSLVFDVPQNKQVSVISIYRSEVFRATMQYIEEFAMYFIVYAESSNNIGKKLVNKRTTDEVKNFFQILVENNPDKFSHEKSSISFKELIGKLFAYDLFFNSEEYNKDQKKFSKLILESIDLIEKDLKSIADYYLEHLIVYNAIKHGTRAFPLTIQLEGDDSGKKSEVIIFICKDEDGEPKQVQLPVDLLVNEAFEIAKNTNNIFKVLRNTIIDNLNKTQTRRVSFFKNSPSGESEKKYLKFVNAGDVYFIPLFYKLNDYGKNNFNKTIAIKIALKNKKVQFHTKYDEKISAEYPILMNSSLRLSDGLSANHINDFNLKSNFFSMSIEHYIALKKIYDLQKKGVLKLLWINDDTNIETKISNINFVFPTVPAFYNEKIIKLLYRLKMATGKFIPLPFRLSTQQNQIITDNIGKNFNKKDAELIISNLKSDDIKLGYINFKAKITDEKGNIIHSRYKRTLGLFNFDFKNLKMNQYIKEKIYENPEKVTSLIFKTNESPMEIIHNIEMLMNGHLKKFPKINHSNTPKIELKINLRFERNFWDKEHFMEMIFRQF
jgi:hypothetical protein